MSVNAISAGSAFSTSSVGQVQQTRQHHGHGGVRRAGMDAAAQALGMSANDLRAALRGGQTLSSLAQSKGVSTDSLTKTISDAIGKANPALSSDRIQQITQRLLDGPTQSNTAATTGSTAAGNAATFGVGRIDRDNDGDGR